MMINHYTCERCNHDWTDVWDCAADDDCPECGARHMSPHDSEDIEDEDDEDEDEDEDQDQDQGTGAAVIWPGMVTAEHVLAMGQDSAPAAPPLDDLARARDIIDRLLDAANHGVTELESLSVDAIPDDDDQAKMTDSQAFQATDALREDYERRAREAWTAIEDARAFLAPPPEPAP